MSLICPFFFFNIGRNINILYHIVLMILYLLVYRSVSIVNHVFSLHRLYIYIHIHIRPCVYIYILHIYAIYFCSAIQFFPRDSAILWHGFGRIWRCQVCMEKAKLPNFERKAISSSVLGAPRAVLPQGVVVLDPWKLETSETNILRIEHE